MKSEEVVQWKRTCVEKLESMKRVNVEKLVDTHQTERQ